MDKNSWMYGSLGWKPHLRDEVNGFTEAAEKHANEQE